MVLQLGRDHFPGSLPAFLKPAPDFSHTFHTSYYYLFLSDHPVNTIDNTLIYVYYANVLARCTVKYKRQDL